MGGRAVGRRDGYGHAVAEVQGKVPRHGCHRPERAPRAVPEDPISINMETDLFSERKQSTKRWGKGGRVSVWGLEFGIGRGGTDGGASGFVGPRAPSRRPFRAQLEYQASSQLGD